MFEIIYLSFILEFGDYISMLSSYIRLIVLTIYFSFFFKKKNVCSGFLHWRDWQLDFTILEEEEIIDPIPLMQPSEPLFSPPDLFEGIYIYVYIHH